MEMKKKIILYGGTGQAKVVRPIVEYYNSKVVAVFDDTVGLISPFRDVDLYCGYEALLSWVKHVDPCEIGFVITIGNPHGNVRLKLHSALVKMGLSAMTVIHPSAIIAENAIIGAGSQVMAGAVIMPEVVIGKQCIINTKASVDHECVIEDGCEVAPGATLCGSVTMHQNAWVCAGATVLPRISIGANSIVGAGSVVINDIQEDRSVVGVPAIRFLD